MSEATERAVVSATSGARTGRSKIFKAQATTYDPYTLEQ